MAQSSGAAGHFLRLNLNVFYSASIPLSPDQKSRFTAEKGRKELATDGALIRGFAKSNLRFAIEIQAVFISIANCKSEIGLSSSVPHPWLILFSVPRVNA